MRYHVTHRTEYVYAEPVTLCHNEAHLTPRNLPGQHVLEHDLEIDPRPAVQSRREDFFGNVAVYFAVQVPHPRLVVTARSLVEREPPRPLEAGGTAAWEAVAAWTRGDRSQAALDARQYVLESPRAMATPDVDEYAAPSFAAGRPLLDAVTELTRRIHEDFTYEPGVTTIATPLADVLAHRRGVCQDFAHLAIACLRSLGLPARYVSGYLETAPPPGRPRAIGADASHAWFAVHDPVLGWVDFDPTNDQVAQTSHITTAWGRDYSDVTPLKGIIFGGGHEHIAKVAVDVERVTTPDPPDSGRVSQR